jgi:hypothetical protein
MSSGTSRSTRRTGPASSSDAEHAPKVFLRFDPRQDTRTNRRPRTSFSNKETRFHIPEGRSLNTDSRDQLLLKAGMLAHGLAELRSPTTAGRSPASRRASAYALPPGRQRDPTLALGLRAPFDHGAPFRIVSNLGTIRGVANGVDQVVENVSVCVPARGYTDVRVSTPVSSTTWPDPRSPATASSPVPRKAGVFLSQIALADEVVPGC